MPNTPKMTPQKEERILHILFFVFGFGIMAWVPRFPEVKANLGLSNGAFGTLLTTGSIGAFIGLLTVGHIVHKVGVFKVSIASTLLLYGTFVSVVHVKSPLLFALCNIFIAFAVTAQHVAISTQAFEVQEKAGSHIITSSAGYWSSGALVTAGVSGLLVGKVGLALHIDIISILSATVTIYFLLKLNPVLVKANTHPETDYKIRDIFTSFYVDWPASLGIAAVLSIEFAVGDWCWSKTDSLILFRFFLYYFFLYRRLLSWLRCCLCRGFSSSGRLSFGSRLRCSGRLSFGSRLRCSGGLSSGLRCSSYCASAYIGGGSCRDCKEQSKCENEWARALGFTQRQN